MLLGFGCILAGFVLQYYLNSISPYYLFLRAIIPGAVLILVGNLLLVVRGYDNRVKFGKYSPSAGWERVDKEKLLEVEQFVKQIKKWDRSLLDVSNSLGCAPFVLLLLVIIVVFSYGISRLHTPILILSVDAAVLLLPHWLTGKKSIMTQPNLLLKTKLIKKLLDDIEGLLKNHQVDYFMLLKGDKTKVPDDVKFRVRIHNQHPDFLGFYGQIVTNMVGSTTYPYFYVVLVAKKEYGLQEAFNNYAAPRKITKEYKVQDDVEVFVIRQTTTRTSGYHTKYRDFRRIFLEGLEVAEKAAVKK
jgi:hypothetical protein